MNVNGPAENVGDITQDQMIMLTNWGEELYRLDLNICTDVLCLWKDAFVL